MKRALPILVALLISAITLGVLMSLPASIWADWRPATCLQRGCFCELPKYNSPIRQRANTISSLGYIFSGMLAMIPSKITRRFSFGHAVIFGASSLIIGVGSAFYHASLTFTGQFFDVLGMFMLATLMLVYAFERIWNLRFAATLGMYLAIVLFLSVLQLSLPDTRRFVFAVVLIVALLFEAHYLTHFTHFCRRVTETQSKSLYSSLRLRVSVARLRNVSYLKQKTPVIAANKLRLGILLLAVAFIIWTFDIARIICIQTSLIQGHAIWHLLGAASVGLLYQYYASEQDGLTKRLYRK